MTQKTIVDAPDRKKKKKKLRVNTNIDFEIRSPRLRTAFLLVLVLFVLVFVAYQLARLSYAGETLITRTAEKQTVYDTILADAFVLRHEQYVEGSGTGIVVPVVTDGTKVSAGDEVAIVFNRDADAEKYYDILDVDEKIEYYESMRHADAISTLTDINAYNSKIDAGIFSLLAAIDDGALSSLPNCADALRTSLTRRAIASGKPVDVSATLDALYAKKQTLAAQPLSYQPIAAAEAGYYVHHTDGFEDAVYDMLARTEPDKTDCAAVDRLLALEPSAPARAYGKLITAFEWYLVCKLPTVQLENLAVGGTAQLRFPDSPAEDIKVTVVSLRSGTDGQTAAVFSSTAMDPAYANLRKTKAEIRTDAHTGFYIPRTAVRTVEGESGVYVLLGNVVTFRHIDIVYETDTFYLAAIHAGQDGYLKAFDEIITEGTELYDGKIIE